MTPHDDPPAVVETRMVHDVQRRATALLADAARRPRVPIEAVTELRDFLVSMLHHHHEREDRDLWPLLTSAAPDLSDALGGLSSEHASLDQALEVLRRSAVDGERFEDAAVAVRDLVHEHLSHEEPILFPALRLHVSNDTWARFSQRTVETASPDGSHLLVGLLDDVGSTDEAELVLRHLPPPAAGLVPAMRGQARTTLASLHGDAVER